jgi:hypothetical protein
MAEEMVVSSGRWVVRVTGDDADLEELSWHLRGGARLRRGRDGWEVTTPEFDALADPDLIYHEAVRLVPLLSAVARLRIRPASEFGLGNVYLYEPDGSRSTWVFLTGAASATGRVPAVKISTTSADGTIQEVQPEDWGGLLELAGRDSWVFAALAFLALPASWHSLYAALDLVCSDKRTGRREGATRWATADDLETLMQTANDFQAVGTGARHGTPRSAKGGSVPSMALAKADELVRQVVDGWIRELGSHPPYRRTHRR